VSQYYLLNDVFSLVDMQDREIIRVIVDCCLHEKMFNKYYVVLASKLCTHEKNHKFSLQVYCLCFILFIIHVQAVLHRNFFFHLFFVNFLYLLKELSR
jgi:hypothetical protein